MHELLRQKLNLNERGKSRKITVYEGIFRRIVEDCLKGNVKSATFLLSRFDAINAGEPVESGLSQDDEAVLEAYIRKVQPKPSEDPQ